MLSETAGPEVIDGPGAGLVTVSGGDSVGVFEVESGVTATLSGLTISGGSTTGNGGGVVQPRHGDAHRLHDQRQLGPTGAACRTTARRRYSGLHDQRQLGQRYGGGLFNLARPRSTTAISPVTGPATTGGGMSNYRGTGLRSSGCNFNGNSAG